MPSSPHARGPHEQSCLRTTEKFGAHFSDNLSAVLAIGGKQREDGRPGPVTAACIQRETGIACSTLRALKSPREQLDPSPDLHTLSRIADALGVPLRSC